ncbi:hypothetical protein V6N11_056275 [Hibiscus sabdariffa]|uniref:Uncharacterized protein n=1 Tax=Hibiscus sabdariffa TaxID=183260 RepID=A0ABR2T3D5_9ROSI
MKSKDSPVRKQISWRRRKSPKNLVGPKRSCIDSGFRIAKKTQSPWKRRIGHGWELCHERVTEFQGPFQFGDWLKVDLSKGRQSLRKKPGIVYANEKQGRNRKEETGEHGMDPVEELERQSLQLEKGKEAGPSIARSKTVKRTWKGKNEVCNPISAKISRTLSNIVGDEDEISEASSLVKFSAQTVEAGSQPRRDQ